MVEAGTVRKLLEAVEDRLRRLTEVAGTPLAAYQADRDLQDKVERNFEVLIQACVDLGLHILADRPVAMPETNRGVFSALVAEGLIEPELGPCLEKMAGFRNVLAHGYVELVAEHVHANLAQLDDVRRYIRQVSEYLREQGVLP